MKKAFAILAVTLIGATTLNAQSDNSVRLGIKVSPNMAWIRTDTKGLESDGSLIGYSFGLMAEFPFGANGNYRFATGLTLLNIGGKTETSYEVDSSSVVTSVRSIQKTRLRYIEIPLALKLMTNEIGYMRYFGQLGFDAGVNLRAKQDIETVTTTNNVSTTATVDEDDVKDEVNPVKLGFQIGGGAEYNFSGSTSMLIGIAYHSSFTTLFKKGTFNTDDTTLLYKAKTYADYFELSLGVYF
ncbi:MAG: PorT family protein [Flavobacteriales bacterium]|nr:PorT family protein [Flavobacteriales bacterium]MBK6943827.1 PorT family protein [Flavobacteriales bacterium]MBK7240037.1 PorT family protein [Flavobacteriales bacterium]MBK7297086.1 PorT family protein [Flavobacteriales bacterium]MBK9535641.1 PorT family protein [Flavobacteriales bacterium]